MSCLVTSVFTFKIESTFDQWAAIFDSAEADKRHSDFDIKPVMTDDEKVAEHKLVGSLMAAEQKMGFSG